ncbi:MAG: hypothetical protein WA728_33235 [Xanthobacteraceae bacterium]
METTGAHTMKSSAPAKSATSTTTGKSVIEAEQTVTNYHGRPPKPFEVPRIRWRSAVNAGPMATAPKRPFSTPPPFAL